MPDSRKNADPVSTIAVNPAALTQVQKLADLGLMTAAVLHEIKQPVAGIKGLAQLLRDGCPDPKEKIEGVLAQVQRMEEMLDAHRRFLAPAAQPNAKANLAEVARQAIRLLEHKARRAGVALAPAVPEMVVEVAGDAGQLMQIACNLIDNAIDAQAAVKRPNMRPVQVVVRAGTAPELLVGDWGGGVVPGAEERLFTAFYTSKAPGTGTGLGLYVSRKLAMANGAVVEHVKPSDAGLEAATVFRLRFGAEEQGKPKPKVLVVDDEEVVRTLLRTLLENDGLQVVLASTGTEGLRLVREANYDLVITDKNLPGATGLDIARAVRERNLDCPVILITAYASLETAQEALSLGAVEYLEKPFDDIGEVRRRVREAMSKQPKPLEPAEEVATHNVVVVCGPTAKARLAEAVTLAGGEPVMAGTLAEALSVVGQETAGVVVAIDLPGQNLTTDLARSLRRGGQVPLILVSDTLSLKDTIVAIHMGAAACLSTRASRQDLAKEFAKSLKLSL